MSIQAIGAATSQLSGASAQAATQARGAAADTFRVAAASVQTQAAAPAPTGSLTETLGSVHDTLQSLRPSPTMGADPIAGQVGEMLPSPWVNSGVARTGATTGAEPQMTPADGFKALEKSYDHAIFVNLVSQVMGGVSHSVSTLVRQS